MLSAYRSPSFQFSIHPLRLTIRGANLSVKTFQTAKEEEEKEEERTFVLASRKGMSHHLQFVIVIIILKFFPPLLLPRVYGCFSYELFKFYPSYIDEL